MIKIIAIGNRFLRDDGIGIAVVERLGYWLKNMKIEVIICETDFFSAFHQLKNEDFVVIIDAAYTNTEPGSIHISKLNTAIKAMEESGSQHELSIFDFIKLYSINLRGYLISIEVAEIGIGYELSKCLENKIDYICTEVKNSITKCIYESEN